jgi:hypothetical protein
VAEVFLSLPGFERVQTKKSLFVVLDDDDVTDVFFVKNAFCCEMLSNFSYSSLTMRHNKLEGLPLENLSSQVLEFEGKARANPI